MDTRAFCFRSRWRHVQVIEIICMLHRINCTKFGAYTVMRICYFRDLDRCWVYLYATCNSHTHRKSAFPGADKVGPTSSTTSTALYETHPAARAGLRHGNCAHLKWQNTMSV